MVTKKFGRTVLKIGKLIVFNLCTITKWIIYKLPYHFKIPFGMKFKNKSIWILYYLYFSIIYDEKDPYDHIQKISIFFNSYFRNKQSKNIYLKTKNAKFFNCS